MSTLSSPVGSVDVVLRALDLEPSLNRRAWRMTDGSLEVVQGPHGPRTGRLQLLVADAAAVSVVVAIYSDTAPALLSSGGGVYGDDLVHVATGNPRVTEAAADLGPATPWAVSVDIAELPPTS